MREDFRFEINIWRNSRLAAEKDWENLLAKGFWVGGEVEEDLVEVWTSDPLRTVLEELERRGELREYLIGKKEEVLGREILGALWG